MASRILVALVYGAIAYLACLLLGSLGQATGIPLVVVVAAFFVQWAVVISIIVAILTYVRGTTPFWQKGE